MSFGVEVFEREKNKCCVFGCFLGEFDNDVFVLIIDL